MTCAPFPSDGWLEGMEHLPSPRGHTVTDVNASGGEPRRSWWAWVTGRGPSSRRRNYSLAALWLFLTALAAVRLAVAEDSTGQWLAGLACLLGLFMAIGYLVAARSKNDNRSQR